jgi:hypothetical protein
MDENIIFGFYVCDDNPNYKLTVRKNHKGLTLDFSDGIETSIDNIWGIQGQSILDQNVTVRFENEYVVDFSQNFLIVLRKDGVKLCFNKEKDLKSYSYTFATEKIFAITRDDQYIFGFATNEDKIVTREVKSVFLPDLKNNLGEDQVIELSDEMTELISRFYHENIENIINGNIEFLPDLE